MTMRNKNIKLIIKVLFLCSFLFFATAEGDSDTAISFTGSQENVIENEPTTKSPLRDKHLLIIPSMVSFTKCLYFNGSYFMYN